MQEEMLPMHAGTIQVNFGHQRACKMARPTSNAYVRFRVELHRL